MARLKYYQDERKDFPEAFEKKICSDETEIVIKKLSRHFKIKVPYINWTAGNRNSKATVFNELILNVSYLTWGLVCHELAHSYIFQKDRLHRGHNKYHYRVMKRMINYCKKKNWFAGELERRTEIKIKPEPSQEELKSKELIHLQEKIVRYEKKVLFYQKKLSKAKKSYNLKRNYYNKFVAIKQALEKAQA